jgi:hypothetical protein
MTITHSSTGLRSSLPKSLHLDGAPERPTVAESAVQCCARSGIVEAGKDRGQRCASQAEAVPPGQELALCMR